MFDLIIDISVIEQEVVFVFYFDFILVEFQLSGDFELMVKVQMGFLFIENLRSSDVQGVLVGIKRFFEDLEFRY